MTTDVEKTLWMASLSANAQSTIYAKGVQPGIWAFRQLRPRAMAVADGLLVMMKAPKWVVPSGNGTVTKNRLAACLLVPCVSSKPTVKPCLSSKARL